MDDDEKPAATHDETQLGMFDAVLHAFGLEPIVPSIVIEPPSVEIGPIGVDPALTFKIELPVRPIAAQPYGGVQARRLNVPDHQPSTDTIGVVNPARRAEPEVHDG